MTDPRHARRRLSCFMSQEMKDNWARSKAIDKELQENAERIRREEKIVLMGANKSGKSTFCKQLEYFKNDYVVRYQGAHNHMIINDHPREFRPIVYGNIISGLQILVEVREKLEREWDGPSNEKHAKFIMSHDSTVPLDPSVFVQFVHPCKELWKDSGIQSAFEREESGVSRSQLIRVKYFMDDIYRIGKEDYLPSQMDILHSHKVNKGTKELVINYSHCSYRVIDIGDQRAQGRKWLKIFSDVDLVLFFVSASDYDQVLPDDGITNCLVAACDLFENVVNHKSFVYTPIMVVLNKMDILEEKIKDTSIKDYFHTFHADPHDIDDVKRFIWELFEARNRNSDKIVLSHYITAMDTEAARYLYLGPMTQVIDMKNRENMMRQWDTQLQTSL